MTSNLDLTTKALAEVLEAQEISFLEEPNGSLYVTGLEFNFWISICQEAKRLKLSTYWEFVEGVSEIEALRCANHCNRTYIFSQFSVSKCLERLNADQILQLQDGLQVAGIINSAECFAGIFNAALNDPCCAGLFEAHDECVCETSNFGSSQSRSVH